RRLHPDVPGVRVLRQSIAEELLVTEVLLVAEGHPQVALDHMLADDDLRVTGKLRGNPDWCDRDLRLGQQPRTVDDDTVVLQQSYERLGLLDRALGALGKG